MPPNGRATKPTPNVAKAISVPTPGIGVGEEQLAEHERGGGAVDEEVVPLERRADGGADDDPPQLALVRPLGAPVAVAAVAVAAVAVANRRPTGSGARSDGYEIRNAAVRGGVPCITTMTGASAVARAIHAVRTRGAEPRSLQELHGVAAREIS